MPMHIGDRAHSGTAPPLIADGAQWALCLDIDGTLVEIAARPELVTVPVTLPPLIADLLKVFRGAVMLATGRAMRDADRLFAPLRLITAGVHGAERRIERDGLTEFVAPELPRHLLDRVQTFVCGFPGVLLETKRSAVTIHFRAKPDFAAPIRVGLEVLLREYNEMRLTHGRKAIEVHHCGFSKQSALQDMLRLPQFAGRRPIIIGDDVMDQAAFGVAEALGGVGLSVAGEHFNSGATFAAPSDVRAWLTEIASCGGSSL